MTLRNPLRERYQRVMDRVAAAAIRSNRRPEDIITVAVTKTAGPDQIRQLLELGHQDLGENRVQQLQQRSAMAEEFLARRRMMPSVRKSPLPDSVRWHMIGHLQRNKVKPVLPLVRLVHSVDSLRLAEEVQTAAARGERDVDILLQVNVANEMQKHGLALPAVPHLAEQIGTMMHLRLRGLMVVAPITEEPEASRPFFTRASELFQDMVKDNIYGNGFNILSMGMSNDFEVAIECGAQCDPRGPRPFSSRMSLKRSTNRSSRMRTDPADALKINPKKMARRTS